MATGGFRDVTRTIDASIAVQAQALDQWSEQLQGLIREFVDQGGPSARSVKNALNGVWLRHPLHPALTDLPIGAWWSGMLLDLGGARDAADASIAIGVLAAVPTALAGSADWSDTEGEQRRVGLVHGFLNSVALGCFVGSLFARRAGSRAFGVGLSTAGLAVASLSAWLGGELVYKQGTGVSRNAWDPTVDSYQVAASADALADGRLIAGEITADGAKLPLVLLKRGAEVLALSGVCSHWGGPLAEGKLVDGDCVECPWHGSRFDLRDGSVRQGPATVAAPAFQARVRDGKVEVRRPAR